MEWSYKNHFWKTKYLKIKNSQTPFYFLYVKLATVQIWEQSNKFPLTLFRVSPSGENIVSRKQRRKNLLTSPTNSAHKHSYLGSQITEPISACKVYFRSPPGEISINPNVSHCTQSGDNFFGCCFFFSWSCWSKMGKATKGTYDR